MSTTRLITTSLVAAGITVAGFVATAAPAGAATTGPGTATVAEGRKVVREADKQSCLTLKEAQKIVHGKGDRAEGGRYWMGKGKADVLFVEFDGQHCAQAAYLYYDNGNAYAWLNGRVLWA